MIPRWKLERELNRIKEQLQQLPWYVYGGLAKNITTSQSKEKRALLREKFHLVGTQLSY